MVDRIIRVVVDPSQARSGFAQIDRGAQGVTRSMGQLRGAIAAAVAALGAREVVDLADRYTILQNRLRLVTESSRELSVIQDQLVQLSRDTRSGLEPTVELYSRFSRATQDLGLSQQETLNLTESINQAIQISGATSQEAAAATIQFAQGLASGALRGDELRSVLEQTPRLAQALADGLGRNVGELRELGAAGELTAEQVVRALRNQAGALDAEFAQTNATVSQGLTAVSDSFLLLVGQIDEATGSSAAFAELLSTTADIITNDLSPAIIDGFVAVSEFITLTIGRLDLFLAGIDELGERAQVAIAEAREESTFLDRVFEQNRENAAAINEELEKLSGPLEFAARLLGAPVISTIELTGQLADETDSVTEAQEELNESKKEQGDILRTIAELEERFAERAKQRAEDRKNREEEINAILNRRRGGDGGDDGSAVNEEAQEDATKLLETITQQANQLGLKNTFGERANEIARNNQIIALEALGIESETLDLLREQADVLTQQEEIARRRKDEEEERQRILSDLDTISDLETQLTLLTSEEEVRFRILAAQMLSAEATQEQIEATATLLQQIDQAQNNQERQLITLQEIDRQFVEGIGNIVGDFVQNFDDGFEGIRDGFADLLTQMAAEILKNIIITQFFKAFQNSSGPFGAIFSAIGSGAQGAQFGGPVTPGQPVIVGEGNRPEVFVSAEPGRIVPVDQFGGGNMTTVIVNEQDPEGLLATLDTDGGVDVQRNFVTTDQRNVRRTLGLR